MLKVNIRQKKNLISEIFCYVAYNLGSSFIDLIVKVKKIYHKWIYLEYFGYLLKIGFIRWFHSKFCLFVFKHTSLSFFLDCFYFSVCFNLIVAMKSSYLRKTLCTLDRNFKWYEKSRMILYEVYSCPASTLECLACIQCFYIFEL